MTDAAPYGTPYAFDPSAPLAGFFAPDSVFKTDLTNAPVADNSAALVANLVAQVASAWGGVAAFNVWQYNSVVYTVGAQQQRINLLWDNCQNKPSRPAAVDDFTTAVPLPSDAQPSVGTDHSLTLYQPSSDTLWGFWKLVQQPDGWHCCWGGKITHVSQSKGIYLNGEGVSATGLADGTSIGINEAMSGQINHAVGIGVIHAADWRRFSYPAIRSDGNDTGVNAIREGQRFRLDPAVAVDTLSIHPLAKLLAKAAQRYGLIVTDTAGAVGPAVESGLPTKQFTGTDPWTTLLFGTPSYAVLKGFPWARLQAMPVDYGKP